MLADNERERIMRSTYQPQGATLFAAVSSPAPCYKLLTDYTQVQPMPEFNLATGNARYTAVAESPLRQSGPYYDEKWFILMRAGLYRAEIEKAMAELYHHFMGYGPEIDIIQENNNYFIASHNIARFVSWLDASRSLVLKDDGSLVFVDGATEKPVTGLGYISVLTQFFADGDLHGSNFGIQVNTTACLSFKIDNEKALEFFSEGKMGHMLLEQELKSRALNSSVTKDITKLPWFISEKQTMRKKIAMTDFSVIETILRRNITSNKLASIRWLMCHMLKNPSVGVLADDLHATLHNIDKENPAEHGVDAIIKTLRLRHEKLREEVSRAKPVPVPIMLNKYPKQMERCFGLLKAAGAEYFALFGGAIRDTDYANRHSGKCNIKDYDIRIWLPASDHDKHIEVFLTKLADMANVTIEKLPSPGTGKIRYCFNYQGVEVDVSIRPIPEWYSNLPIPKEAVAIERAANSDIALSSIAIDPLGRAWAMPEYLDDQLHQTLTVYPNTNEQRCLVYTQRMSQKFPSHVVVRLEEEQSAAAAAVPNRYRM
jgi:hypothetical protein